jgi:uncharacterized protein (UPF0276 family)
MQLAINYSHAAARLVQSGQIDIDTFKTPDWDWLVSEASQLKPVAVHFTLEAGNDNLRLVDWDKVRHLSQITGTPYINLHLDARQMYYPDFSVDTANASEVDQVVKTIISDVKGVAERFGPERVIIENSPYREVEGNTMRLCVQPDMITHVIKETGCGLLLDISHAIISANSLGIGPDEYISKLPLKEVKEMHFAGIQRNQITGQWMDHVSIQESDWHWLDWVLDRVHSGDCGAPKLLAFEYGGVGEPFEWRSSAEVILEQVPMLYKHIKFLND